MDNLEEMDKFLERYNLPRLNQEEIENMNTVITSSDIELVTKKLPANKSSGLDSFTGAFCQTYSGELKPILLKRSKTLKRREHYQIQSMRPPLP